MQNGEATTLRMIVNLQLVCFLMCKNLVVIHSLNKYVFLLKIKIIAAKCLACARLCTKHVVCINFSSQFWGVGMIIIPSL